MNINCILELVAENESLRSERNRYKTALEFYKNPEIYLLRKEPGFDLDFSKEPPEVIDTKEWGTFKSIVGEDSGAKAREALGEK